MEGKCQWFTQYIPQEGDTHPQQPSNALGMKRRKFNNLGIYYPAGMGCSLSNDCFHNCPFPDDCHFGEVHTNADYKHMADPGNGIKP